MSIGITQNGNPYQKTNKGKIIAAGIGALAGACIASENTKQIRSKIRDVYISSVKKAGKGFIQTIKDFFTGKFDFAKFKENAKFKGKIAKYGNKVLRAVKKHPVIFGMIAGALTLFGFGALIDNRINRNRAKEADGI